VDIAHDDNKIISAREKGPKMQTRQFYFFLIVLVIATCVDLLVPVVLGKYYPGYDPLRDTISALGAPNSPVQKYECATLIVIGSLILVFAFGQARSFESMHWSHNLYILGIILFGLGSILAGFFPEDPVGVEETISGKIHGIASGLGFLLLILNPLWSLWISEFSKMKVVNTILFPLAILTFVLFLLSENRTTGVLQYTGLFQRLNLFILYGGLILNFLLQYRTF
jgi:hypothetical membrane protein